MKKWLFFLLTIITNHCYSQISFEKGYYIDNSGQKNDCLIKNMDWKNNPTEFQYKLFENDTTHTANIENINEFGIDRLFKYVRCIVDIDISTDNINDLTNNRNPVFEKKNLFLKLLVEGKANLYSYEDGSFNKFFFNKEGSDIEQLIYKRYKTTDWEIEENNQYKQQLRTNLNCTIFKMNKLENLKYRKSNLIQLFAEYNKYNDSDFINYNYEEKKKKDVFYVTIRPQFNNSSLTITQNISNLRQIDFGNKFNFGLGIDTEIILPFNKNKWTITIEPTYQYFKSKIKTDTNIVSGGILISEVSYQSIDIPLGIRYYLFFCNNSKFFINVSYVINFNFKSFIEFKETDNSIFNSLTCKDIPNYAFGIGYKFGNKYSFEIRYHTKRNILGDYLHWSSKYHTLSLVLGYSIC